jgi:malate permease and related proteins
MNELLTVLTAVLPVFGIMGVGFWLRRVGWLSADADHSLMRLTINLLLPSLIFDSVLGNAALRRPENLLLPPLLGYGMMAVGVGVARCFAGLAGMRAKPEQRTFAFLTGLQNYSYLTIPLCLSLFGSGTMGVLFVHNVGTDMAMWTLGVATLTGAVASGGWKKILNAPLLALLLALLLNFLCLHYTPSPALMFAGGIIRTGIHWFGQSAIPMALLIIGAIVADHFEEARGGSAARVVIVSSLVRLGVMPVLFLLLAKYFPCSADLKRVLILQGAMPSATFPIVLAKHYGGDARVAVQIVLGTSLLGMATTPLWIQLGEQFVFADGN